MVWNSPKESILFSVEIVFKSIKTKRFLIKIRFWSFGWILSLLLKNYFLFGHKLIGFKKFFVKFIQKCHQISHKIKIKSRVQNVFWIKVFFLEFPKKIKLVFNSFHKKLKSNIRWICFDRLFGILYRKSIQLYFQFNSNFLFTKFHEFFFYE